MPVPKRLQLARRWIAASRPGFLAVTASTCAVGIALSQACGAPWDPVGAVLTMLLALLTHAAVNLYNDYGDAVGGSDAINTARLTPFTGGSRVIQTGEFSASAVHEAARILAIVVIGGGVVLAARAGPGLLLIGAAGLALGWAYSSPRVALMSRGLGELGVAMGWWLVVVGADFVQRHGISAMAAIAGVSPALLVCAVLMVAEFPDAAADAASGKRTLVVRLGARRAAGLYAVLVAVAHAWLAAWWWADWLAFTAWWALGSAPLSAMAALLLWRHAGTPARLRPAIVATIAAAVSHGVLFTAALLAIVRLR